MTAVPRNVTIVELSVLKAGVLLWQPPKGSTVLTVVCKATYKLEPGTSPLAESQDDVNSRDLHAENNTKLGLHSANDLVPFKPRADVTVVGKAFAPPNELASSVIARVRVGTVDKKVEVHAERYINRRGQLKAKAFFSKMPIGYDRAPGGPTTINPIGLGLETPADENGRVPLPNIQMPGEVPIPGSPLTPWGLGPVAAMWPTRKALRGSLEAQPSGDDWLETQIPQDTNWAFFNVAPIDQQLDEIRADETIHLEHLHPKEPTLDTKLSGCRPCVFVERSTGAQRVKMKADTLWIDTNRLVQTLTWRGQIGLDSPDEEVRVLAALADGESEPTWDEVWVQAEEKQKLSSSDAPASSHSGDLKTRVEVRQRAPHSRNLTSPVPLVPGSDHSPMWLPTPSSRGGGPVTRRAGEPSAPAISSKPRPLSQPTSGVVELPLDEADMRLLHELAFVRGVSPVEVLRQLLREANGASDES
jgi:hypothetical protein